MVTVSNCPLAKIDAYKSRMDWSFKWVSSLGSEFNRNFGVTFTQEELDAGKAMYNYRPSTFPATEAPGASAFYRDQTGEIFHTYSCYGRGLDMLNAAYHYLDLAPKGRDEAELPYPMAWVRRHDQYD